MFEIIRVGSNYYERMYYGIYLSKQKDVELPH